MEKQWTETQLQARLRIDRALEKIEEAQRLLGEAASDLCPIVGAVRQWRQVCKLYDRVKSTWYSVNRATAARRFDLDSYFTSKPAPLP